jgi:hypothetical protein
VATRAPCLSIGSVTRYMRASLAGLDEGTFTEGHELDPKTEKQVPKAMIGLRLSQEEARRLLANFGA